MKDISSKKWGIIYIILGIAIWILFFIFSFPRMNYHESFIQLKDTAYSAIDFEHQSIKSVTLPDNITLEMKQDKEEIKVTVSKKETQISGNLTYSITLSPKFEIIKEDKESNVIRGFLIFSVFFATLVGFIYGIFIPFPILLLVAVIYDKVYPPSNHDSSNTDGSNQKGKSVLERASKIHDSANKNRIIIKLQTKGNPKIDRWGDDL